MRPLFLAGFAAVTLAPAQAFVGSPVTRVKTALPHISPTSSALVSPLLQPSTRQEWNNHHMSVEGDFDAESLQKAREEAQAGSIKAKLRALYKFTRPHTIRGTILASIAGTIRALIDTPTFSVATAQWSTMLPRAFAGMIALLCGNAFIVGINQIYDKEIDEMNKPFLPVASGEMSKRFAWVTVVASGLFGPILV